MAEIHQTTMEPGKLELLSQWLPDRPWYTNRGVRPELVRVGGFRLDDPAGQVGIELMVVRDDAGHDPTVYLVPITYRGAPLESARSALIGISEHGVLGRRWIYDGTHDPVLIGQLLALLQGRAQPQHQSKSDTPDPSVKVVGGLDAGPDVGLEEESFEVDDESDATAVVVHRQQALDKGDDSIVIRVIRVLVPERTNTSGTELDSGSAASVRVSWQTPDGFTEHAAVVTVGSSSPS